MATKFSIVKRDSVDPKTLLAHPLNHRRHPIDQKAAMLTIVKKVGWVDSVLVNLRTGRIVNGHLRVELACDLKELTVPVKYIDVSEETEAAILATYDSSARMATVDKDLMSKLIESVKMPDIDLGALLGRGVEYHVPPTNEDPLPMPPVFGAAGGDEDDDIVNEKKVTIKLGDIIFKVTQPVFKRWYDKVRAITGSKTAAMREYIFDLLEIDDERDDDADEHSESDPEPAEPSL